MLNQINNQTPKDVMLNMTKDIIENVPIIPKDFLEEMIIEALDTNDFNIIWNMAFNFNEQILDKSRFEDFVISSKNQYWLEEFITSGFIGLNLDRLNKAYGSYFLERPNLRANNQMRSFYKPSQTQLCRFYLDD